MYDQPTSLRSGLMLGLALAVSACSTTVEEPGPDHQVVRDTALLAQGTVTRVSIRLPERSTDDVRQKAADLLDLFSGEGAVTRERVGFTAAATDWVVAAAEERPNVRVDYNKGTDTIELTDVALARVRGGDDVAEAGARARLEEVLAAMTSRGVVASNDYSAKEATLSPLIQGEGWSEGGPPTETVKEYVFFIPKKIGGVIVNDGGQQDLGLTVSIHRQGFLRRVRIAGIGVSAVGIASNMPTKIDEESLETKVRADFPDSEITPIGLRYSLGEAGGAPRQAYMVSRTTLMDGLPVKSRAKIVYYSVGDDSAAPVIWPTPQPEAASERKRP